MSEEEKESIYKTAIEVGEIIGRYGTDKQIELFEKVLEDYKIKNSLYFKLQKENIELKTKLEIEKTDNLYNKEEANEEMVPKYKVREIIYPTPENMIPLEVQTSDMYRKLNDLVKE
jgi:hypothetical protein